MATEFTLETYRLRKDGLENYLKSLFPGPESEVSVTVSAYICPRRMQHVIDWV